MSWLESPINFSNFRARMFLIEVAVYGPAQRQQATIMNKHQKPFLKLRFFFFICLVLKSKIKRKGGGGGRM